RSEPPKEVSAVVLGAQVTSTGSSVGPCDAAVLAGFCRKASRSRAGGWASLTTVLLSPSARERAPSPRHRSSAPVSKGTDLCSSGPTERSRPHLFTCLSSLKYVFVPA